MTYRHTAPLIKSMEAQVILQNLESSLSKAHGDVAISAENLKAIVEHVKRLERCFQEALTLAVANGSKVAVIG